MPDETADTPSQPEPLRPGWELYGLAWGFAVVRAQHEYLEELKRQVEKRETEIAALYDRLLMRASITPMTKEMREERHTLPPDPGQRREFKAPIAAHNAAAREQEKAEVQKRRSIRESLEKRNGNSSPQQE